MPIRSARRARPRAALRATAVGAPARPAPTPTPTFRTMTPAACNAVLRRNAVGRIAYAVHNRVDIEPIHYVYDGSWLFGRTSHGTKLTLLRHSPWVAFEVDEIEDLFDWKSVVVHGTFYTMAPGGPALTARAWQHGIALLRQLIPETRTRDDPVAFRTVVFGIHVNAVTGRTASSQKPSRTMR